MKKLIALSGGHGMETRGKETPVFPASTDRAGQRMKENEFNDAVLAKVMRNLKATYDVDVFDVAPGSTDVPLRTRTRRANNSIPNDFGRPADLYLSIHANALDGTWSGPGEGVEVLYYPTSDASKRAAEILLEYLAKGTVQANRGIKPRGDLHELRESHMPAILAECGFMDDLREAKLLISESFRAECAAEITAAVAEIMDLQPKEGDDAMTEEMKAIVEAMQRRIDSLEEQVKTLQQEGQPPEWAEGAIVRAKATPAAAGDGAVLNAGNGTRDFHRIMTVLDRLGLFGRKS